MKQLEATVLYLVPRCFLTIPIDEKFKNLWCNFLYGDNRWSHVAAVTITRQAQVHFVVCTGRATWMTLLCIHSVCPNHFLVSRIITGRKYIRTGCCTMEDV